MDHARVAHAERLCFETMPDKAFSALVEVVKEHFEVTSQADVAAILNRHQPQVATWLQNGASKKTWKELLTRLVHQAAKELVWPLLEFSPIAPERLPGGGWRIDTDAAVRTAIRNVIDGKFGIYTFYDSAGRVVYVGRATKTNMWTEAVARLNAKVNRAMYFPKRRHGMVVGDLACFISSYGIGVDAAGHNIEQLLLRTMPNDNANTQIGDFNFTR